MKIYLRTPISYYGGKQQMLRHILPLIPEHKIYVEPFFGGGAVFWGKEPVHVEVINDINALVVNFYKQLKSNYFELKLLIDQTLHSREQYKEALVIYHAPYLFDEVRRAWAFWVTTNMGFTRIIGSWGYDITGKTERYMNTRKVEFTDIYSQRLETTQIECNDAVQVIRSRDNEYAFHYCDPPYINADQGHYGGYTQEHFDLLIKALSEIKGKFLLSSYPNDNLDKAIIANNWFVKRINMNLSASSKIGAKKIEVLTANYEI
jgi:DNA adenine methylase